MNQNELNKILEDHKLWLNNRGGKRADLSGANLRDADLSDADLRGANLRCADLRDADLSDADLRDADLSGANLSGANLRDADLRCANLRDADLRCADLSGADLRGADLSGAQMPNHPLRAMFNKEGDLYAYKYVTEEFKSPLYGDITYKVGSTIEEPDFDEDDRNDCSKGINLATLEWCLKHKDNFHKIIKCKFSKEDIVAIPYATDGKFRVKRCEVVEEVEV